MRKHQGHKKQETVDWKYGEPSENQPCTKTRSQT